MRILKLFIFSTFLLFCLTVIGGGFYAIYKTTYLQKNGIHVTGTVVGIKISDARSNSEQMRENKVDYTYYPIFKYPTQTDSISSLSMNGGNEIKWKVGDTTSLIYHPKKHAIFVEADSISTGYWTGIITSLFGGALLALVIYLRNRFSEKSRIKEFEGEFKKDEPA
ncbi:MAG: hypothetical protein PHQ74_04180 [Crocinitomicaceae bacterium]|nr:hypothetical protein [Crocinitomicaceae bacterium]